MLHTHRRNIAEIGHYKNNHEIKYHMNITEVDWRFVPLRCGNLKAVWLG